MVPLTPFTTIFILLFFGIVSGAYLPLALIYLVGFVRRAHFGFGLIWKVLARLLVIAVLLILLFAALGFATDLMGLEKLPHDASLALGFGVLGGLFGGLILFVVGLIRGRSRQTAGAV
jgi:hypothetical protein